MNKAIEVKENGDIFVLGEKVNLNPADRLELAKFMYQFEATPPLVATIAHQTEAKSLHNTTANGATKNVRDIQFWGNGDAFQLLCKASSEAEGWMKSTKAMQIDGVGCVVQITTQQRNHDGSYAVAEAATFVPGVAICEHLGEDDKVVARSLQAIPVAVLNEKR